MNRSRALALLAGKAALGASLALGLLLTPHATARADYDAYAFESTVNLSDVPDIDALPDCAQEDGSDVPAEQLPCLWVNQGNTWLTYADRSFLVIDDTVTP